MAKAQRISLEDALADFTDDLRAANQEVFVLSPADSVAMLATAGRTESR